MKICFVITKADEIGGAQIHVRDLSMRLKIDGHEVTVIVGEDGQLVNQLRELNVNVIIVNTLKREISLLNDIRAVLNLNRILKSISPDIVSLHSSKAGVVGRITCMFLNVPVIFTAHGWAFADGVSFVKKYIYIIIERLLLNITDRVITVSKQDQNLAEKYNVSHDNKLITIHNGMRSVSGTKNYVKSTEIKIISVARFSEQKDHKTLLEALVKIKDRNWTLDLVGKGPLLNKTKLYVDQIGLGNRVKFLGERHDVNELLFNYDIYTLISNWEGFPRSILEAMRTALPVIASDVGGVNEAVKDGDTGFLVPRGEVDILKNKLEDLIDNEALRSKMGQAGKRDFEKSFTFEAMYNKTLNVYNDVLKSRNDIN
jgi:glycosyltransferase involved in cell wall biosynthesis